MMLAYGFCGSLAGARRRAAFHVAEITPGQGTFRDAVADALPAAAAGSTVPMKRVAAALPIFA